MYCGGGALREWGGTVYAWVDVVEVSLRRSLIYCREWKVKKGGREWEGKGKEEGAPINVSINHVQRKEKK